jgi:hypothetical protein
MDDVVSYLALAVGVAALAVGLVTLYPYLIPRRIDRDPKKHYRFEGPDYGWHDLGDAGRPQLTLNIWNYRSIPVDLGIQVMDVRPGFGGGGRHLFAPMVMIGHTGGSFQPLNSVEVPAHGHRRLSIMGQTPERGYRGDLGVAVMDGDRRVFLVYHHANDDPPPFEGSADRNAVPGGAFPYASGTFGEARTIRLDGPDGFEPVRDSPTEETPARTPPKSD